MTESESTKSFTRIAIVNRGEAALRLILAVRELKRELDLPLRCIALYTEPDADALFVREADEAYNLGPALVAHEGAPSAGPGAAPTQRHAYLDLELLERALREVRAEAVWPGWGFVAERADFAELCERMGMVFIGPDATAIRRLGDKISSKQLAEESGLPVAPWSGGPVDDADQLRAHAERLGYPLMIKASAGGGGRGIRAVRAESELAPAFASAQSEARKTFGDGTMFVERLIDGARHLEVPIMADGQRTWALGVRDCSVQRRFQKLLEESPCPALSCEQDRWLQQQAVKLVEAAGYRSACTVEFLHDPRTDEFTFLEVNARLQVEHPISEVRYGIDLVKLQLALAWGGELPGEAPKPSGHAIEVRLYAEDPEASFAPAPGTIERLRVAGGPGIRADLGYEEGDRVPAVFDSMVGKIVAHGKDRAEALARLRRALADSVVLMSRGATTRGFMLDVLRREALGRGEIDVFWLDRLVSSGQHIALDNAPVAIVKAAIDGYEAAIEGERREFFGWAARGRPRVDEKIGRSVELIHRGHVYRAKVCLLGPERYQLSIDGQQIEVELRRMGRDQQRLHWGDRRYRVRSIDQGQSELVEVDGIPHRISRDRGDRVLAPAPAVVVSVLVKEGDQVAIGDRLAMLEAMKTEMAITARFAGRVRQVLVLANQQVAHSEPLMLLEPPDGAGVSAAGERMRFEPRGAESSAWQRNLEQLRCLMLGFDVDAKALTRYVAKHGSLGNGDVGDAEVDGAMRRQEDAILGIFCDIAALFPIPRPGSGGQRSTVEYLLRFLRDPDVVEEGLPESFLKTLRQAVSHYGVTSLEASPKLRQALYRIYKSHTRVQQQLTPILGVLQRRLDRVDELAPQAELTFRQLLDDLITHTRRRFPAVLDLAREVRYQFFDQPVLERVGAEAYRRAEQALEALEAGQGDDSEQIESLVRCPQALHGLLADRYEAASPRLRGKMLEALTRRHYRIRELSALELAERDRGRPVCTGSYTHEGATIALLTTWVAQGDDLAAALADVAKQAQSLPPQQDLVIDVYTRREQTGDIEALQAEVSEALQAAGFGRPVRRVVVGLAGPGARHISAVAHVTFRQAEGGFVEDRLYRGLHPMVGKRMNLWRLSEFEIKRLPSPPDIFLFHGVARQNPKDERLFVLAEVRDLTPMRDEAGKLVGLPYFERIYGEALAALRRAQLARGSRLYWNRLQFFVWPPMDFEPNELRELVQKLAPATEGLGLEKTLLAGRVTHPKRGELVEKVLAVSNPGQSGVSMEFRAPPDKPMRPLSEYEQKVVRLRQRGLIYPYELIKRLTPSKTSVEAAFPAGEFVEYDLDEQNQLVPVERPYGKNSANIVVGLLTSFTDKYPEGMTRVALLGDPSRAMGSLAEQECRRILAALDLAEERRLPLEWYALSAGAEISMKTGTENMDWISWVLRRLITYTQAGNEINVVVCGINVGAQPYWNAEATMLMHTKGILIMTPDSAMVLTGKRALDYSGGVSADDNTGIGGYERIMGPNGQGQYFGRDLGEACQILLRYYDHSYVMPGERFPRRGETSDPIERDVSPSPHAEGDASTFETVGQIFSLETNPGRKRPFDIRSVMAACADQDHQPLERWFNQLDAEIAVVWEAHIGGWPVCLMGIESKPLPRLGFIAADGPGAWTPGTLFPIASKKVARTVNAVSGNRPLVILANLSGFDGSPESMRDLQLEYGAEIGRAVVNFRGPIVFCVVSRYHGGAFVVFSNKLNESMEVAALEGTYASVIGGAPAAAVVFARDVKKRTLADPRLQELSKELQQAEGAKKAWLQVRYEQLSREIHSEKLGEVAEEFDGIHSVQRAQEVGSVHRIIPPHTLRPYLVDAIERGVKKEQQRVASLGEGERESMWQLGRLPAME
jgi:acetyl/propionyl-CoA carboxylase alpha subunit/acetyl-CoA carboxylase carboxyltransferase component